MEQASNHEEPRYEVVAISLWKRLLLGGEGPELTLAEAAAALGVSVDTIRRRIRAGDILARRDVAGRYRVVPLLRQASDDEREALYAWAEEVSRLEKELRETRERLDHAQSEQRVLSVELDEARDAEVKAQSELTDLWQRLNEGVLHVRPVDPDAPEHAGTDRVQNVIFDARSLFKRRRRWPLVG